MRLNGGWKTKLRSGFGAVGGERALGCLLLLLVILLPLLWMVGYAFLCSLGNFGLQGTGWTLDHWSLALTGSRVWRSLLLSSTLAVASTFLAWQSAVWLVSRRGGLRTDRWLQAMWCLPVAIPPVVQAFLANLCLNRGGLLSRICWQLGLTNAVTDFPVLVQDRFSIGLLLTMTAASIPLLVLFLIRIWGVARIDDYLLTARALGASPDFALRKVAVPMLRRRSRSVLLLVLIWNFSAWELPLLLGRQSPRMFSVLIQQSAGQFVLDERPQAFVCVLLYLVLAAAAVGGLSAVAGNFGRRLQESDHG
jgi:putative spermidine/putrescine transport system permease protein